MLRAVKDANELAPARGGRRRRGRDVRRDRRGAASPAGRRPTSPPTSPACCGSFGHEQVDFTVVGSGPNGANPHHEAGDRVIEPGDAVVLDFGGLMYGYGSDTTRTVCVGEPTRGGPRGPRDRAARPSRPAFEAVRPGRGLPGDRPGCPGGHHRRGVRRAVHPPHRPRHRRHDARAAVHGRGRGAAARARACASPSSPASTSPGGSGSGSRTSSRSTETGGLPAQQHRPRPPRRQ